MPTTPRRRRSSGGTVARPEDREPEDLTLVPRIVLVTGVFLCPVVFDRGAFSPFDAPKVATLWGFGIAALGLWSIEVLRGRLRSVPFHLGVVGGLFVLAVGVATVFSRTPVVSLFGWHSRASGFVHYGLYAAIAFLVAQLYWRRPERLKELIYALGAASILATIYVIVQSMGLDPLWWGPGKRGRFGTLGNSNFAGGFLGATSPWLLFAFWRSQRFARRALVTAWTAVTVLAIVLTGSGGGVTAFALSAVVAAIAFRRRLPRWVLRGGAVAALLLAVVPVVLLTTQRGPRSDAVLPAVGDVFERNTLELRFVWWRSALSIFAESPLVGTGPDTFVVVFPRHMPREAAGKDLGSGVETTDKPHNVFLDYAASMGLFGLATYGALFGAAMTWGLRKMRRADPREADLLGTFVALIAGYSGQAFFSIDVAPLAMVGWVGLGGVAALADPGLVRLREGPAHASSRRPRRTPPRVTPLRWSAVGLVAVLTATLIVAGTRPWRADRASRAALDDIDSGDLASARRNRARAIDLYPVDPVHRLRASDDLMMQAESAERDERKVLLREAIAHVERADRLQPGAHLTKLELGEALSRLGLLGEPSAFYQAGVAFEDATELAPYDWRVWVRYGDMLNRWGRAGGGPERHCLALAELERALELKSSDASAWRSLAVTYTHLRQFDRALDAIESSLALDPGSEQSERIRDEIRELGARGGTEVEC